jgi:stearoyl-CoA desaturase (delta-9 desaturase)
VAAWLVVTTPPAACLFAAGAGAAPSRFDLTLLVGLYLVTMLGLTAGLHRLFSHRAYRACLPVKVGLAIAAGMAIEGPIVRWVAQHRRHHAHSDGAEDPHSPGAGLWHAHVGWMLGDPRTLAPRFAPDLLRDRVVLWLDRLYPLWMLASLALPALLGGLADGAAGAWSGLLWGGLIRIALVHQASWAINSLGHRFGTRPFVTGDHSRNNALLAALTLGEGWHNNHHAFPTAARHGLRWWQLDATAAVLETLARLGLVSDLKSPAPQTLINKERKAS